ncbi:protein-glutamate O-methyltransferase CheR [soil metagenome]
MTATIPDYALDRASVVIEARLGLSFPPAKHRDLERMLNEAAEDFGAPSGAEVAELIAADDLSAPSIDVLARHLTIGETYFFREKGVFDALEHHILPEIIRQKAQGDRRISIWSAGCCTGEEPYSIAMLLERLLPDINDWNIQILATDLNPEFLRRAAQGVYKQWSFRDAPPDIKERFFKTVSPGAYEVLRRVRERVTFRPLNLAGDAYPSAFTKTVDLDIILCRNVLMYFSPEQLLATVAKFHRALAEKGLLIVSPTETSQQNYRQFKPVTFPGAVFYRKDATPDAPTVRRIYTPEEMASIMPPNPPPACLPRPPVPVAPAAQRAPLSTNESGGAKPKAGLYEQAVLHYNRGDAVAAIDAANRLLHAEPRHARALTLTARIAADQGRLAEALERCDRSLGTERLSPSTHHLRAAVLEELGRKAEASAALRTALYIAPDFVLAHFALGRLAAYDGDQARAAKHFSNVVSLLRSRSPAEELPDSGGLTAGRLLEITRTLAGGV